MNLTENQLKAVKNTGGNVLVNSSAGSGKTAVFTARIANLIINEKVDPGSILGLTFTKDAAENMRKRLSGIIGKANAEKVNLSTFHSFSYRLLISEFPMEYKNIKITEMWWKLQTVYDIIGKQSFRNQDALNLDIRGGEMLAFISYQKSNMIRRGTDVLIDDKVPYVQHISRDKLQVAYNRYCDAVKHARTMDFDDMILDTYFKLTEDENLLNGIKNKYKYIMIDEFQDTNSINMEILKLMSDNNLFAVGDFRQGVYGFINANIDNILEFRQKFDDVELIELSDNFRSTDEIVSICNDLIDASPNEKYKGFSGAKSAIEKNGVAPTIKVFNDEFSESEDIVDSIEELIAENPDLTFNDFCILCRTNAQLGVFESILADREIPARLSDSRSFFDRKEIADVLAYAEHTISPDDDMSLRRIANSPTRYISRAVLNQLDEYAYKNNKSVEDSIGEFDAGNASSRLDSLKDLFVRLREHEHKSAFQFLQKIYKLTNYLEFVAEKSMTPSEHVLKVESLNRLLEMSKKFSSIKSFLTHIQIIRNNSKKQDVAVNVMTAHASKGLEFKHVYVASVTEENYPHTMTVDPEEERRLLYVAMSRAIETLTISTHSFSITSNDTLPPSPFLRQIMEDELADAGRKVLHGYDMASFQYKGSKTPVT